MRTLQSHHRWVLAPPSDCVDICPRLSTPDYQDVFAVCPSWNNMTNITVVNIPANVRTLSISLMILLLFHVPYRKQE